MAEIQEKWSAGEKTLAYSVELEGAVVTIPVNQYHPPRRYRVDRVSVRTRWAIGQEEEGRTFVILYCRAELSSGRWSPSEGKLYLEDLPEVPPWLEDIITRGSPRDVG